MEKPEISVIVPVYNVRKYLQECIESVIAQSFSEWELLLVDDGSTDGSGAVCDEYAQKDKRIRVFHKENGGVSSARNLGLDNAEGEWIAFLDGDDYFPKETLKVLHDKACSSKADLIIGKALMLDNGSLYYHQEITPQRNNRIILSIVRPEVWGYLFRKEIILKHSLKFVEDLAFGEDNVFISYYVSYCDTMDVVQTPIYVYRTNEVSVTHSINPREKIWQRFEVASHLYRLAQSFQGMDEQKRKDVFSRCNASLKIGLQSMFDDTVTREDFLFLLQRYKELFGDSRERLRFLYKNLPAYYVKQRIKHFPRLTKMAKRLLGKATAPRLYRQVSATEEKQYAEGYSPQLS
ncbi:MAG: glycosyltransferase [Prevotellaceae bacterium]|nr:glycosyltransferase [Prevotellaceae bacterium]